MHSKRVLLRNPDKAGDERVCEKGLAAGINSCAINLSSTKLSEAARSHSAVHAAHRRWIKSKVESAVPVLSSFFAFDGKNHNLLMSLFIFP